MILRTKKAILPALLGAIFLSTLNFAPAQADDTIISVATSDSGKECLDTTAQRKLNETIDSRRIVMPYDKGAYVETSLYGPRISPITGQVEIHTGSDFSAPDKTPIYSIAEGVVTESGPTSYLGEWVIVRHNISGKIYDSVYGHLTSNSQKVKVGDKVSAGQHIADEGSTGLSTGPHLHLELWENGFQEEKGKHIDALKWLKSKGANHRQDEPTYKSLDCAFGTISKAPNTSWGGYKNGEIPNDKLQSITFNSKVKLEAKAAAELEAFNNEFQKKFKKDMPLIRGYEDLKAQAESDEATITGKSFFGWGKSIELKFTGASNTYMPLVSEPDYFTDEQYVWMMENGQKFGWFSPEINHKDGDMPDPGRWVYSEKIKHEQSRDSLMTYANVESMTQSWNNEKNRSCIIELWTKDGNWDSLYNANGEFGISKLTQQEVEAQKLSFEKYTTDPTAQVSAGLKYVSDKYTDPCHALDTWKTTGKY